jgi:2'-5' RNA ligase
MRLFVSVDLPQHFAAPIAAVQDDLRPASGFSPTDPEQAHVTLTFLGEVEQTRLEAVTELVRGGVADAGLEPFECTIGSLGVFPSRDYINVVWLGIDRGGDALCTLHEAIESRAIDAGFDAEAREFTPHVTIGRMKHGGGKQLVQERIDGSEPAVGTCTVDAVRLKESTRTADGPTYSTINTIALS